MSSPSLLRFAGRAAQKAWRAFRDGRLRASPREWAYQLRQLWHEPEPLERARDAQKRVHAAELAAELRRFLDGDERIVLPPVAAPAVSAIVVLHGRAELTLRCLR